MNTTVPQIRPLRAESFASITRGHEPPQEDGCVIKKVRVPQMKRRRSRQPNGVPSRGACRDSSATRVLCIRAQLGEEQEDEEEVCLPK